MNRITDVPARRRRPSARGGSRRRPLPWLALALCVGLVHSAPAWAAESITVTPAADAIEGNPITMTVSTTTDSTHASGASVYVRRDDGTPCQASASAVRAAMPTAVGVYGDKLRAAPVTFDAPAQNFVGGLRVCAFVQIVPAPQTTLSSQDIVIPIRAPTGTLQVQATTASPFVGGTFAVRLSGSSEAANGNLFDRVQRGPCTPLSANAQTNLEGNPITAGAYDMTLNAGIDGSARVLPDRVCGWLYSDGGLLLATSQQLISPQFDGSLVVTKKRFISFKRSGEVHWLFYFESHTTGKITAISFRHVSGGRCLAFATRRKGSSYKLSCLLASRPRAPFVFEVKYTTGLGAARSTGHVSLAAPKQRRRPA